MMLVLSRQLNEAIMIGDDIELVVVDIRGDRVRLGINAPKEIPVHRKEIYLAIQEENIRAAQAADAAALDTLQDLFGSTDKTGKDDRAAGDKDK